MSNILHYPFFREKLYLDESGNYTKKFQAILFLMRVTGIPKLYSLVDVFDMVLRIKIVTTILMKKLNAKVSTYNELIVLNVNDQQIGITIKDIINHLDVGIIDQHYQSIQSYTKKPLGNLAVAIMKGNNGIWSTLYANKTYIDNSGAPISLPPFAIFSSGEDVYEKCKQSTIRDLAMH